MRETPPAGGQGGDGTIHRVTVRIFGEEYVLRGEARPAYMERLADMVDRRMNEIAKRHPRLGITRIAVLAAINLADELSKLEEQYQRVLGMLEREWDRRKRELNGRPAGPGGAGGFVSGGEVPPAAPGGGWPAGPAAGGAEGPSPAGGGPASLGPLPAVAATAEPPSHRPAPGDPAGQPGLEAARPAGGRPVPGPGTAGSSRGNGATGRGPAGAAGSSSHEPGAGRPGPDGAPPAGDGR